MGADGHLAAGHALFVGGASAEAAKRYGRTRRRGQPLRRVPDPGTRRVVLHHLLKSRPGGDEVPVATIRSSASGTATGARSRVRHALRTIIRSHGPAAAGSHTSPLRRTRPAHAAGVRDPRTRPAHAAGVRDPRTGLAYAAGVRGWRARTARVTGAVFWSMPLTSGPWPSSPAPPARVRACWRAG